jgi:hypothetical protein
MNARYHVEMTQGVLAKHFTPGALREVVLANVGQDSLRGLFGIDAHRHCCDPDLAHSWAYVDAEHALIEDLAARRGPIAQQRAALGRLLHTVQDFYAHTNYVDLWLTRYGLAETDRIDGLDDGLIGSPELRVGEWIFWRDSLYYIPVVGRLLRRIWLPAGSHEAMNLDSPAQGPRFSLALSTASQRTRMEYRRALRAIGRVGGSAALKAFHAADPASVMQWAALPSTNG